MACALLIISAVVPSLGARATASAAVVPPAPTRFSTTTGWPRISESGCATMRAAMSVPPPAPKPSTMRIGCFGQSCAKRSKGCATIEMTNAASAALMAKVMQPSFGICVDARVGRQPRSLLLVRDRIDEHADFLDVDLAGVATLHEHGRLARETDAGRRTGDDDVARLERHALGDINERLGDRE